MTRRYDTLPPRALAAFLEGEVTPSEALAIEAHLRDSGTARRHLEQLDDIRRALARQPDGIDETELAAVAHLRRALETAVASPPRAPRWSRQVRASAYLGAAACAAVAVLVLARASPWSSPPQAPPAGLDDTPRAGLRAKAAATASGEDRWVRIEVLRVGADGAARPLLDDAAVLHARDRLVFRYVNGGSDPFGFLMVLAVDAAGQIHWYYPAYETAGSDPSSVPILRRPGGAADTGEASAPLPDEIEHDLAPGPLVFYGVFTRSPLRVLDVEQRVGDVLARHGGAPDLPLRLPIEGAGQHAVRAIVVP